MQKGYRPTHIHDMIAAPIHLGDPILALWAFQYSVPLQVPAQMYTHTDLMQLVLTYAVEHVLWFDHMDPDIGEAGIVHC